MSRTRKNFLEYTTDHTALLAAIASGDRTAFDTFYKLTSDKLYGVLCKIATTDKANEVLQEVYIKLWDGRHNLGNVKNASGYLYTIAIRSLGDHVQSEAALLLKKQAFARQQEERTMDPAEDEELKAARETLLFLLNTLPPQQRLAVRMHKLDGFSHQEIANKLGIKLLTVNQHIKMAMKKLKSQLQGLNLEW